MDCQSQRLINSIFLGVCDYCEQFQNVNGVQGNEPLVVEGM